MKDREPDESPVVQESKYDTRRAVYEVGPVTLEGRIVPDANRGIYRLRDRGTEWYATVQLQDPMTGKEYVIENVRLLSNGAPGIMKTHAAEVVSVSLQDRRDIANGRSDRMVARILNTRLGTTNENIPIRSLMADWRNRFNAARNEVCNFRPFDFKEATSKLNQSRNLTVVTDPNNPKAPAVVVDNARGEVGMYTASGNGTFVGPDGVTVDAGKWNQGTAKKTKQGNSTLGLQGNENDYQDFHPRSTIINQIPVIIPPYLVDMVGLLKGIGIIYRVARATQVAIKFISSR